jgi:hypothetical protein
VLVAAHGEGAEVLQRTIVTHDVSADGPPRLGAPAAMCVPDVEAADDPQARRVCGR